MTRPAGPTDPRQLIAVVGAKARGDAARAALLAAGITDLLILDGPAGEVRTARFDDGADGWRLTTSGGETVQARVVIAADAAVQAPWVPDIPGRDHFAGESFHAAAARPGFDPSGKRVAVVGTDTSAGHLIARLLDAGASVTVFPYAPRRVVTEVPLWSTRAKRWLRARMRPAEPPPIKLAASTIEAVTSWGIRTGDGVEHCVDAIVYGTGFSVADKVADQELVGDGGSTLRQVWHDGMEPFYGVALCGFPNYFFMTGPDACAQGRYIAECLRLMERTGSSRIEVRGSSLRVFNERAQLRPERPPAVASVFDLSSSAPMGDDTYDGAATLEFAGATPHPVRVRLTGHLDPIDGHYHWQGTVFESPSRPLPGDLLSHARTATLTVGGHSAAARIVERTPWGTHSVAGVGAPPYAPR